VATANNFFWKNSIEKSTELLIRWIVYCHIAFFQLENQYFRELLFFLIHLYGTTSQRLRELFEVGLWTLFYRRSNGLRRTSSVLEVGSLSPLISGLRQILTPFSASLLCGLTLVASDVLPSWVCDVCNIWRTRWRKSWIGRSGMLLCGLRVGTFSCSVWSTEYPVLVLFCPRLD
jgi:hypothetical protein